MIRVTVKEQHWECSSKEDAAIRLRRLIEADILFVDVSRE